MQSNWRKPKLIESASLDIVPGDIEPAVSIDESLEDGTVIGWHAHDFDQWLVPSAGAISVFAHDRCVVVPNSFTAYIPAGCLHTVATLTDASLRTFCVGPGDAIAERFGGTDQLTVGRLIEGEPIPRAISVEMPPRQKPGLPVHAIGAGVRIPVDRRARPIAFRLIHQPDDVRTLRQWGEELGASERTLNRIFRTELGLGYREWRMRLLVLQAVALLIAGRSVKEAAAALGYTTSSAFVAGFRAATGITPLRYAASVLETKE